MADVPQTTALIIIAQNYAGDIVRQINRTATLLKLLAPTFKQGEGKNVAWVAEGDGAVAETFAEGADPANFGSDSQTGASIPFARYWSTFHVTGSAMAASSTSRTPVGNIELWARQMVNGAEALAKKMDTDLYVGAGGNAFVGLDEAIGDDANTYATIARAGNVFWRPTVSDSASAPITFAQIRSDLSAIKVKSGYKPDLATVSPDTYNKIAALYDPLKQYVYQTVDRVQSAGQEIVLDGGVGALKFDGCYFVEDSFAPDNTIYYLNSRYIRLEYMPAEASLAMGLGDEASLAMMMGGLSDGFDVIPFNMVMELLAKTGDAQKAMMKCYPQLCVERPNAMGVRINIG